MHSRKSTFLALSQFIHHHLLWFLVSAYAIATVYPTTGLWIRNLTFGDLSIFQAKLHVSLLLLLLATLMFNAGLGVKTSHLKSLLQKIPVLFAGLHSAMHFLPTASLGRLMALILAVVGLSALAAFITWLDKEVANE